MKKKKFFGIGPLPLTMFLLAVVLIGLSTVGGVMAYLTIESEHYYGAFEVKNIGIELTENGIVKRGKDTLLTTLVPAGQKFSVDTQYPVALASINTGDIDQYVRIEVYRYWEDANGDKVTTLDPKLIELTYGSGWIVTNNAQTSGEKVEMVYPSIVPPGGATTPFVTAIEIDGEVLQLVNTTTTTTHSGITTYWKYSYDGLRFVVEAEADAVQTHNAWRAIWAAWGLDVTINDADVIVSVNN